MVFSISLCIPYQWDKLDYSAVRRPLHLSEREHGRLCFASALCSSLGMREALLITITQGLRSTELLSSQMLLANMVEGGKENPCGVSKCQLNSSHWNLETIICINKYLYETSLDQCYNKGGGGAESTILLCFWKVKSRKYLVNSTNGQNMFSLQF